MDGDTLGDTKGRLMVRARSIVGRTLGGVDGVALAPAKKSVVSERVGGVRFGEIPPGRSARIFEAGVTGLAGKGDAKNALVREFVAGDGEGGLPIAVGNIGSRSEKVCALPAGVASFRSIMMVRVKESPPPRMTARG